MQTTKLPDLDSLLAVHRYATPLAILTAGGGILATPPSGLRATCAALLAFTVCFNVVAVEWMRRRGQRATLLQLRTGLNFMLNCVFVLLLGWYWEPIWLLLFLSPLITALFRDRRATLFAAAGAGVELLALNGVRASIGSPLSWGMQATYAAAMILISLMLNDIVGRSKA